MIWQKSCKMSKHSNERGEVSMLTLSIFMVAFSVLVVGFSYVMVSSVKQTTNDTLSYAASQAADSGVEDAKRILMYCMSKRTADGGYDSDAACKKIMARRIDAQSCNDVLDSIDKEGVAGKLGITLKSSGDSLRAKVGNTSDVDAEQNIEYYQCLKIASLTPDYIGYLQGDGEGKSYIIPLRLVEKDGKTPATAARLYIEWHKTAGTANSDGPAASILRGKNWPDVATWQSVPTSGTKRPAAMRVQFVSMPHNDLNPDGTPKAGARSFSIQDLVSKSGAVTLRPNQNKGKAGSIDEAVVAEDIGVDAILNPKVDPNVGSDNILRDAACTAGTITTYACNSHFTGTFQRTTDGKIEEDTYLRLSAIYENTHFRVRACKSAAATWAQCPDADRLYFDSVQPQVDVTGKSGEAYQRIEARLEPQTNDDEDASTSWWPEYAVDTQGELKKCILSKWETGDTTSGCNR